MMIRESVCACREWMRNECGCLMPVGAAVVVVMMFVLGFAFAAKGESVGVVSGSDIPRLYAAIAKVESDRGETSGNVYQLTPEYVADVNRIQRKESRMDGVRRRPWSCCDVMDGWKSEAMMAVFWRYYARRLPNGGTMEELAKIHHVGFRGMRTKKTAAEVYWRKVMKQLAPAREAH